MPKRETQADFYVWGKSWCSTEIKIGDYTEKDQVDRVTQGVTGRGTSEKDGVKNA